MQKMMNLLSMLAMLPLIAVLSVGCEEGPPPDDLLGDIDTRSSPGLMAGDMYPSSGDGGYFGDICIPDRMVWEEEISPIVAQKCGACHGEVPSAGAPFAIDYEGLFANYNGERVLDLMTEALRSGSMPLIPFPKLSAIDSKRTSAEGR